MKPDPDIMESTLRELLRLAETAGPGESDFAKGYRSAMGVVGTIASFALSYVPEEIDDDNLFPEEMFGNGRKI
jgi:hypothetical protein